MTDRVIIVGAGMGGLATALRLSAAGRDVILVEAHDHVGGKMRTLPSAAGPVDAGPTVLTMRQIFDDLFASCGTRTEDHVSLEPEPLIARHFWPDGSTLDLWHDPERSVEAVIAFAGARAGQQFRAFSARAKRLYEAFDGPMMQSARPTLGGATRAVLRQPRLIADLGTGTLATALKGAFSDPRLRQLFGRYATYVGGSPYHSPAVLALIWQAECTGVWRVKGGMHKLAQAMARLAEAQGVEIRLNSPAERIEVQGGRAVALHLSDGARVAADFIVFNGDPRALYDGLLGDPPKAAVPTEAVMPRSLSAHVGTFAARPNGPELAYHNVFFGSNPKDEFGPIAQGRMPEDPTIYICAQDRGGRAPTQGTLERFQTIMNAPPTGATPLSEEEITTCLTRSRRVLAQSGLTFSPDPMTTPAPETLTTQADFHRLFPASGGSLYGRSPHGRLAAFSRPTAQTNLPGLVIAGGGAHPGAGIPMATLSGKHAAEAILNAPTSTSRSHPTAMPGGTSTGSAMTATGPSRSLGSSAPSSRPGTAGLAARTPPTTAV